MATEGKQTVEVRPDYLGAHSKGPLKGSFLHRDQYEWQLAVTVSWSEKSLNYCVVAYADEGDQKLSTEWTNRLTQTAARLLKTQGISPFKENDLTYHIDEGTAADVSISVELDEKTVAEMEKHCDICLRAEKSWRRAVDRLCSFARGPSEYALSEAQEMIFHLQWNLDRSYTGDHGWYYEKLNTVRQYAPSLARRKQRNHHNYKMEQDMITEALSAFTPPKAWKEEPILLDSMKQQKSSGQ